MVNNRIRLSIVIPVYNAEKTIDRLLKNIINANANNFEVIIVDDGSTDHSYDICRQYADKNKNTRIIKIQNSGVSAARNIGIVEARGDYILFVDSDDYISGTVIDCFLGKCRTIEDKTLYKVITRKECEERIIFEDKTVEMESSSFRRGMLDGAIPGYSWGFFYKKELLRRIMYDEELSFMEDFVMLYEYLFNVDRVVPLEEGYYYYNVNSDGISQNTTFNEKHILDCCKALKKLKAIDETITKKQIEKKQFRVIESEIGKSEQHDLPSTYTKNFFQLINSIKCETNTPKYRLFYRVIIQNNTCCNIYMRIRAVLKKIKGRKK